MINIGGQNAILQQATARFEVARARMQLHFNRASVPTTQGVLYLKENTVRVHHHDIQVGSYIVLPASVNAQAATPTVAHLDAPGGFKLSSFRAHEVNPHGITFLRTSNLSDDISNDACITEADETYGSIDNRLFNRFPVDEDAEHTFEVAIAALQDACKAADPHNVVPPPAAVEVNPLNAIGQVLRNQQQQHAQGKANPLNTMEFNRFASYSRVCLPGAFPNILNLAMVGLPAGVDPCAGYFSATRFREAMRNVCEIEKEFQCNSIVFIVTTVSTTR
jgi:hypothetical protein